MQSRRSAISLTHVRMDPFFYYREYIEQNVAMFITILLKMSRTLEYILKFRDFKQIGRGTLVFKVSGVHHKNRSIVTSK